MAFKIALQPLSEVNSFDYQARLNSDNSGVLSVYFFNGDKQVGSLDVEVTPDVNATSDGFRALIQQKSGLDLTPVE